MLNEGGGPWGGGGADGGAPGAGGSSGGGSGGGGPAGPGGPGGGGNGDGLGPRDPWSQPPRRRPAGRPSVNPPALEELLRRGRARFGGGLPGNFEGRPIVAYAVLALLCLWIILTSMHRIEPQQRGVVTRFGRYETTLTPGIGITFPAPIDVVTKVNVDEIRQIDVGAGQSDPNLVLTGDQNIIDLAYSARWSISDPERYLFEIADPEKTIHEVAESAMRAEVARISLQDAIGSGRGDLENRVQIRMQQILDRYHAGIIVQGVAINQADPPAAVNDAFKAVSAAQQQAQSDINGANAYAQQMAAKAQGDAASFDKVYAQYRLAPEVTRRRMYYETMEDVLAHVDKTIVQPGGVVPYLPLPAVKAAKPAPAEEPAQ